MKKLIKTLTSSKAGFAPLVLRVPVGLTLAAHGSQKLFGMFGGWALFPYVGTFLDVWYFRCVC